MGLVRPAVAVVLWLFCAALLLWSGHTFSGRYTSDILTFWDGAHRILEGQVPNRHFHYPLGPLTTYLPALGLWLGGSLGAMMPWATVAFTAALVPILAYASVRLPLPAALCFIAFSIILAMAPLVPGDHVEMMSFAMFYNRWGWTLLAVLGVLLLPRGNAAFDAISLALLLVVLIYLKVTFAVVGVILIIAAAILLADRRLSLLSSLGITAIATLLVELAWRGSGAYFTDIQLAAAASGTLRGTLWTFGRMVVENLEPLLIFALAWLAAYFRQADWRYLVLCAALALAGLPLLNQSAQASGILTLVPAAILAVYAPARSRPGWDQALTAILALPPMVSATLALGYHTVLSGRPQPYELDGLASPAPDQLPVLRKAYSSGADRTSFQTIARHSWPQPNSLYLPTVIDGISLLRRTGVVGGIATIDIANPFNAALTGRSPKGMELALAYGRTLSLEHIRGNLFEDADYLMIPKAAWLPETTALMVEQYKIRSRCAEIAQTDFWVLCRNLSTLRSGRAPGGAIAAH